LNVLAHRAVQVRHEAQIAQDRELETTHPSAEIDDATLWALVQQLPARWQESLTLRYVAGLPYADIGRVLSISEAAARMLVQRAVEALRKSLMV